MSGNCNYLKNEFKSEISATALWNENTKFSENIDNASAKLPLCLTVEQELNEIEDNLHNLERFLLHIERYSPFSTDRGGGRRVANVEDDEASNMGRSHETSDRKPSEDALQHKVTLNDVVNHFVNTLGKNKRLGARNFPKNEDDFDFLRGNRVLSIRRPLKTGVKNISFMDQIVRANEYSDKDLTESEHTVEQGAPWMKRTLSIPNHSKLAFHGHSHHNHGHHHHQRGSFNRNQLQYLHKSMGLRNNNDGLGRKHHTRQHVPHLKLKIHEPHCKENCTKPIVK